MKDLTKLTMDDVIKALDWNGYTVNAYQDGIRSIMFDHMNKIGQAVYKVTYDDPDSNENDNTGFVYVWRAYGEGDLLAEF